MKNRLFRTKNELRNALAKDIRDRKTMKKEGHSTKGITQVIQRKKRLLNQKRYWKD